MMRAVQREAASFRRRAMPRCVLYVDAAFHVDTFFFFARRFTISSPE